MDKNDKKERDSAEVREKRGVFTDTACWLRSVEGLPMKRLAIALVLLGLAGLTLRLEPAGNPPNVLLVTFDALRADHLGVYGYPHGTSPNIDALAKDARVFTDCVSQCASTVCSLPSLHTSKFPQLDASRGSRTRLVDR